MFFRSKKVLAAMLFSLSSTVAFAQGTLSGTDVDSTASLTFTVNGNSSTVTDTNSYKVDNKVDMVVSTTDLQAATVNPGANNVVLKYRVQNNGNTVQDFLLSALTNSQTAFSGSNKVTDNSDLNNVRVFVDSNNNGRYDPDIDTQDYIDELAPDATKTVFIVADVPSDAPNNNIAVYDLEAQVAEGNTPNSKGNAITSDDSNQVDDAATVQIVFADGAGSTDAEHDGKFSSADAWRVVTATVTISKDSIVVSDPVNGNNNPKRIPGAVVRYCYIVKNAEGGAEASGALVTDTLDTNVLSLSGATVKLYGGNGTCDCNTPDSDITASNGANGQDPNAQGVTKIDFGTVAGGATECAYVSATIK